MEGLAFPGADSFCLKIIVGIVKCEQFVTNAAASQITGVYKKKKTPQQNKPTKSQTTGEKKSLKGEN